MQFRGASTPNNGVKLHDGWPVVGGRLADVPAETLPQEPRGSSILHFYLFVF
jgi:hypothetical protein